MNEKRLIKISRYLDRVGSKLLPPSLQVALTDHCNNNCYMCGHHKRKNKYTLNAIDWIDFLYRAKDKGLETICYCGGDSILHPHINSIMKVHGYTDIKYSFITSGSLPDGIDMYLLECSNWVRVSLDAVDDETYKKSRGGSITASEVIHNIGQMIYAGVNVELSITVHERNKLNIRKVLDFALKYRLNCDIKPMYGRTFEELELTYLISKYSEMFRNEKLNLSTILESSSNCCDFCSSVYYQGYVDAKGNIHPCCLTAGDTEDSDHDSILGNIWNINSYIEKRNAFANTRIKFLPDICKQCSERFIDINKLCLSTDIKKSFF